jgi:hypothetical protein
MNLNGQRLVARCPKIKHMHDLVPSLLCASCYLLQHAIFGSSVGVVTAEGGGTTEEGRGSSFGPIALFIFPFSFLFSLWVTIDFLYD